MTDVSQNGWPVLVPTSKVLHDWRFPSNGEVMTLQLRRGAVGFVLCHFTMRFSAGVETVLGQGDDFGYSRRRISGSNDWSNHASATAMDLNASAHPQGVRRFSATEYNEIHDMLEWYDDVIKWGGDFRTTIDEMHFEIDKGREETLTLAEKLLRTPRGRRLIGLNPGQARFIG